MRIQIVSGFLGAGKTTFIMKYLVKAQQAGKRVAVLVNEFGDVNLDSLQVQQGYDVNVVELASGCICCTLKGNLVKAMTEIKLQYEPEVLLVEPSGIASPSGIIEAAHLVNSSHELELEPIITLVDATNFVGFWEEKVFGSFMEEQITLADLLLISKTDLAEPEMVAATEELLQQLNPLAIILPVIHGEAYGLEDSLSGMNHRREPAQAGSERRQGSGSVPRNRMLEAVTLPVDGVITTSRIKQVFKKLEDGDLGRVIRAKGVIDSDQGPVTINYVPGQLNIAGFPGTPPATKLVFIGIGLKPSVLASMF